MMKQMLKILGLVVITISVAHASLLKDAIRAGKACEKQDGFVQATQGHEGEVADLVANINTKRQKLYAQIAAERGISLSLVAQQSASERRAKKPERFCKKQPGPCR